jgi:hypothetical protein
MNHSMDRSIFIIVKPLSFCMSENYVLSVLKVSTWVMVRNSCAQKYKKPANCMQEWWKI